MYMLFKVFNKKQDIFKYVWLIRKRIFAPLPRYLFCQGYAVGRKKRADTIGARDTSLTSTASRRFTSRRSYQQSTIQR